MYWYCSNWGPNQPGEWAWARTPTACRLGRRLLQRPKEVHEECRGIHQEELREEAGWLTGWWCVVMWSKWGHFSGLTYSGISRCNSGYNGSGVWGAVQKHYAVFLAITLDNSTLVMGTSVGSYDVLWRWGCVGVSSFVIVVEGYRDDDIYPHRNQGCIGMVRL